MRQYFGEWAKKVNHPIRMTKPMILIFDNNLIPFCSPDAADKIKVMVKKGNDA